jgi:putative ABC transport system permease protein
MFRQIFEIVMLNLKALPQRLSSSLVIVIGIAGVVGVFTALFAMSKGIEATLVSSGDPLNAMVMRGGSQDELNSTLSRDAFEIASRAPGVRRGTDGQPLASGELIVIAELPKKGQTLGANVTLRGIGPQGLALRPRLKIIEGRRFTPGVQELLVGKGATEQFEGLSVGKTVRLRSSEWTVVGLFESGDVSESEILTDSATAQTAWGRPNTFSTLLVGLETPEAFAPFETALKADPRMSSAEVKNQLKYYNEQTEKSTTGIRVLGTVVAIIMGLGAIFAALNTMYASISSRTREIATLRAIGFSGLPVVVSVMAEAAILATLGGLIGAVIAYVFFNGMTVSTLGGSFTQLVFNFKVSWGLIVFGMILAIFIGLLGGLVPAVTAAYSKYQSGIYLAIAVPIIFFSLYGISKGLREFSNVVIGISVGIGVLFGLFAYAKKLRPHRQAQASKLKLMLLISVLLGLNFGFLIASYELGSTISGVCIASIFALGLYSLIGYLRADWTGGFFSDPALKGLRGE